MIGMVFSLSSCVAGLAFGALATVPFAVAFFLQAVFEEIGR